MGSIPPIPGYLRRPITPADRRRAILVLLGDGLLGPRPAGSDPAADDVSRVASRTMSRTRAPHAVADGEPVSYP